MQIIIEVDGMFCYNKYGDKMKTLVKARFIYATIFLLLFATEVIIALFVKDDFIRPYGGDILVTVLLCALVRIFVPEKLKLLPLYVFAFSIVVELAQYVDIVGILGLSDIAFFRIIIGTSFSFIDILCYGIGCLAFFAVETLIKKGNKNNEAL